MSRLPRFILILAIALAAFSATGACFLFPGHKKKCDEVAIPAGATAVAIPKKLYGEPEICAVSGQTFSINRDSRSAIFHGRTYFLRDQEALKRFLDAPEGYVPDGMPAPENARAK